MRDRLLSRRDLLRVVTVGAGGLLLSPALLSCRQETSEQETPTAATSAAGSAKTPSPAASQGSSPAHTPAAPASPSLAERPELRVGVQGLPPVLDPDQALSNVGTRVTYSMFDYLIERDFLSGPTPGSGFELVPMIASEWNRLDDLTIEFRLREDVRFHNGDRLTAEDVVFTFQRLLSNPPDVLLEAKSYFSTVAGVEAVDEYTVRFTTAYPDPIFEKRISSWGGWILPQSYYEQVGLEGFARRPVGTGPYRLADFQADDHLTLKAFDDYFGGRPTARRITFRVIPEIQARVTALANGEVDIITNVPPDQVPILQQISGVEVRSVPLANCHVLRYNCNRPELRDKRIRQALNLAIDRKLLVDTLWSGLALLTRGYQFEDWGALYNPDRPFLPYDPERARALLREAGYNGELIRYNVKPGYYTLGVEAAQAIVEMWKAVGINAEVQLIDWADLPKEERMVGSWSNSNYLADPEGAFWLRWGKETATQRDWWTPENPRFNELGEQQRRTLDQKARYRMIQEMIDIWLDEAPGTVLYIPIEHYGVRTGVEWTPYSFYYMDFRPDNLKFS